MNESIDQDHWLYIADLVVKGSEYPDGRLKFARAMEMDSSPYERQDEERVNASLQGRYEEISLAELNLRTTPGFPQNASSIPTITTFNNNKSVPRQSHSNTWNINVLGTCIKPLKCYSSCVIIIHFIINAAEKPPNKDTSWDVTAFKVFCKISPTNGKSVEIVLPEKIHSQDQSTALPMQSNAQKNGLCPMGVFSGIPEVEQTLRLISYQGINDLLSKKRCRLTFSFAGMTISETGSISICWGRINQILKRQLLVNFYGDFGSSGGAVCDRYGLLVGILSASRISMRQSAFIEPLYPLYHLLRSGIWKSEVG